MRISDWSSDVCSSDLPPVNLRQGAFAKRRQWKVEWPLVRRMAWLVAGILLLTLAIQVASIFRYTFAADALEAETAAVAASVLPGSGPVTDPARELEQIGRASCRERVGQ